MLKGMIFDLDGVIVSTDEMHYLAWQELADELRIPFDRKVNNRFRGVSRMACMDILEALAGKPFSHDEKLAYATKKNERYRALLSALSPADLDPQVKQTLDELRARGLRLAIGSSSKNARYILERIGLSDYFDAISDGNNIAKSKPDPEVFLKAAEFLSLSPSDCAVIEDAYAGVDAANAGGFTSVGVGDAATYDKADYTIGRFAEILELPNL